MRGATSGARSGTGQQDLALEADISTRHLSFVETGQGMEAAELLSPPLNVVRLSLHPRGLAPRIVNILQWRSHILERLRQQITLTADPALVDLLAEVQAYPMPE